jgi:Trypsin-like peptidase domain
LPDRVSFLTGDSIAYELHSVPLGWDPTQYAKDMLARLQSIGRPVRDFSIAKAETVSERSEASQPALSLSRQLQHSTVRLECRKADGNLSSGTGFHMRLKLDEELWVPAIITNKHVVNDAVECTIHFTLADEKGASLGVHERYVINSFQWLNHPDDNVDLVLIPLQPLLIQLAAAGKRPFYIDLTEDIVPDALALEKLSPLEEILMIGYPNGIWDSVNNFPIFRRGITATGCNSNYLGRSEFLVDAAVFPGSSGSPVFIFNQSSYVEGNSIILGGRVLLIGVLYAVHLHTAQGEIKTVTVPTDTKSMTFSAIPNNLGVCIHSARILDFKDPLRTIVAGASQA